jgi:hypothetical protein
MAFDFPDNRPLVTEGRTVTQPWLQWLQFVQNVVSAAYSSGPTAQRPAKGLWIGRTFYDTDLGYPVWVHAVKPAVIWHNAAGLAV